MPRCTYCAHVECDPARGCAHYTRAPEPDDGGPCGCLGMDRAAEMDAEMASDLHRAGQCPCFDAQIRAMDPAYICPLGNSAGES